MITRGLPVDSGHNIIQAGKGIHTFTVDAPSTDWTPITLPVCSKGIVIKTRDTCSFKLAHEEGGEYVTINTDVSLNVAARRDTTVCWVQPLYDTTFEILIVR